MSSTVACIGFTDPTALASIVREKGEPVHELSSTSRWVDTSGAMLLLDRTAQYARPCYATTVRTPYRGITPLENGLAQVTLTDVSGFELDPFTVVPNNRFTVGWAPVGRVALVAMGVDTEFFATAEDFFDSPRSALPGFDGEPPAEVKQFNLPWPPAMEIETFIAGDSTDAALATLSGTVQFAEIHTNSETGHEFLVSRIATVCGEIDLCTPVPLDGVPAPGSVTVGQVELLAGFPAYGVEDTSPAYEPTADRVHPTFRDGQPDSLADVPPTDIPPIDDMPEGLVLGEDGVVRTTEEHAAWKGGDTEAGSRGAVGASDGVTDARSAEDDFDRRRELPATEVDPMATAYARTPAAADAAGQDLQVTGGEDPPDVAAAPVSDASAAPSASGTSSDAPAAPTPSSSDDDSSPRPGETRREWRERTGR